MSATVTFAPNQGVPLPVKPSQPRDSSDNFFWTYTEEPHRTRRQAIIKAHPEVWTSSVSGVVQTNLPDVAGDQALWIRAVDQVHRACCRNFTNLLCCVAPSVPGPVGSVSFDFLPHRRHSKSESIPRHS